MLKFWKKKDKHATDDNKPSHAATELTQESAPTNDATEPAHVTSDLATTTDNTAAAATSEPVAPEPALEETPTSTSNSKRRWRDRLSGSGFARGLSGIFKRNPKLDDTLLDELETTLITADVGVTTSMALVENLRQRMHKREFADSRALLDALRTLLLGKINHAGTMLAIEAQKPFAILVVGVNGVGKTTTIGKLAQRYKAAGHKLVLAAGDTFRAAAVEQLKAWGERTQIPVIAQGQGADSASVIYDAMDAARARGADVLLADTAGRLHTQGGLMDELSKVIRVMRKLEPSAPHEVLMVVDGNTGQNAISQVQQFKDAAGVTGLVVTKLDGTAKGGVIFALAEKFDIPIRFVGLGEGIDDLRPFDPIAFVDGLLPDTLAGASDDHDA